MRQPDGGGFVAPMVRRGAEDKYRWKGVRHQAYRQRKPMVRTEVWKTHRRCEVCGGDLLNTIAARGIDGRWTHQQCPVNRV